MSLDALLREPESSSPWGAQRAKLIRLALGTLGAGIVIAVIGATLVSSKIHRAGATQLAAVSSEEDARLLAQLMRVQKEANDLSATISDVRQNPSTSEGLESRTHAHGHGGGRASATELNYDPGQGFAPLRPSDGSVYIPTGSVFQASLLTPIKTSVQKTFVMAETSAEFRMDGRRRIPRGSRLVGRSQFDRLLKGVVVEFETVVFPNGIESSIGALALSRNALPEIDGLYFSDKMVNYGTALAFGFLSGFADAARSREDTIIGSQPIPSVSNDALTGLSTASFQVANEMIRDIQNNAIEYVVVPAGEQVFVVLTQRYQVAGG